jgi:uncharacterized protein with GYD domain
MPPHGGGPARGWLVASFIGLLTFEAARPANSPSAHPELAVGRAARALAELHGGRFLSIFWTRGEVDMVLTFEGRDESHAARVFEELGRQQGAQIRVLPALTEGEKEWALRARSG